MGLLEVGNSIEQILAEIWDKFEILAATVIVGAVSTGRRLYFITCNWRPGWKRRPEVRFRIFLIRMMQKHIQSSLRDMNCHEIKFRWDFSPKNLEIHRSADLQRAVSIFFSRLFADFNSPKCSPDRALQKQEIKTFGLGGSLKSYDPPKNKIQNIFSKTTFFFLSK
jgi:hypothetical protein